MKQIFKRLFGKKPEDPDRSDLVLRYRFPTRNCGIIRS
jgi:hypothetical protein